MNKIISSIAPLLLVLASAAAFSTQQKPIQINTQVVTTRQLQTPTILFADETDASESSVEETASDEVPKAAVKCPDCDLCDGSGR